MTLVTVLAIAGVAGVALAGASLLTMRAIGARLGMGRRLAGPPEVKVGRLTAATELPSRPVRVVGRIRCTDPLLTPEGDRLVAFHRDVEVRVAGRWRSLERVRETRSFELWDHDGSLTIDPAEAAEPLIVIPAVWHGQPTQLDEPHASAAARMAERHGPISAARSVTRSIAITDRLAVLALVRADSSRRIRLEPPPGGFLIANLPLADAMRLLGGTHRRLVGA
ncbi:MAG: hypothetical protein ACRDGJ_06005, partial [Candidatus Limnocylindria bacterium]